MIERTEKNIIFRTKDKIKLLNNKDCLEFFIDVTFDIIPKIFRPIKLMSIATLDLTNNKTYLVCFIIIKYLDTISYKRIFEYLNKNFSFNPLIIHTDYEESLAKAIKNSEFFQNNIIHVKCLFHFVKTLMDKLKKFGYVNKMNYKEIYTIIINVELLERLSEYKIFLIENLSKFNKYNKFITYIKNY